MSVPNSSRWLRHAVISILLFGLFAEWLIPLYQIQADMQFNQITPLFVALVCYLVMGCVQMRMFLRVTLQITVCIGTWVAIYTAEGQSWLNALNSMISTIGSDLNRLIHLDSGGFLHSSELRTALLIVGWAMLVTSVQSLALHRQSSMLFIGITLVYLLILLWGFGIDTTAGFIRAVAESLLLLALLRITAMEIWSYAEHKAGPTPHHPFGWPGRWLVNAIGIVVICFLTGFLLSERSGAKPAEPMSWNSSMASLEKWASTNLGDQITSWMGLTSLSAKTVSRANGAAETGYSENDTELGSALVPDSSDVFQATTPVSTYWRGETKRTYDGRGWSAAVETWADVDQKGKLPNSNEANTGEKNSSTIIKQTIRFTSKDQVPALNGLMFAGGDMEKIHQLYFAANQAGSSTGTPAAPKGEATVQANAEGQAYRVNLAGQGRRLAGYDIDVRLPVSNEADLRINRGADPQEITSKYLQLPASLPSRISDLTAQIIVGQPNRYDAVKAVEAYLRTYYSYTLTDTSVPAAGKDFVDHFLFTQKKGYCNHFSTAMVVMLRTQGIPARWVKGFAPGEASTADPNKYTVRMQDAHSWVEVYFPDRGWIAFEPTPGFQAGDKEQGIGAEQLAAVQASKSESDTTNHKNLQELSDQADTTPSASRENFWTSAMHRLQASWTNVQHEMVPAMKAAIGPWMWMSAIVIGLLGLTVILLRRYWLEIQFQWAIYRFRSSHQDPVRIERVAALLWRKWDRQYGAKAADMTMREYIKRLEGKADKEKAVMWQLVYAMEQIAFNDQHCERVTRHRFIQICRRQIEVEHSRP